jgi:hypothetical protein
VAKSLAVSVASMAWCRVRAVVIWWRMTAGSKYFVLSAQESMLVIELDSLRLELARGTSAGRSRTEYGEVQVGLGDGHGLAERVRRRGVQNDNQTGGWRSTCCA